MYSFIILGGDLGNSTTRSLLSIIAANHEWDKIKTVLFDKEN